MSFHLLCRKWMNILRIAKACRIFSQIAIFDVTYTMFHGERYAIWSSLSQLQSFFTCLLHVQGSYFVQMAEPAIWEHGKSRNTLNSDVITSIRKTTDLDVMGWPLVMTPSRDPCGDPWRWPLWWGWIRNLLSCPSTRKYGQFVPIKGSI